MSELGSPETTETLRPTRFDQLAPNARLAWSILYGKTPDTRERVPAELICDALPLLPLVAQIARKPTHEHLLRIRKEDNGKPVIIIPEASGQRRNFVPIGGDASDNRIGDIHNHPYSLQIHTNDSYIPEILDCTQERYYHPQGYDRTMVGVVGVAYPIETSCEDGLYFLDLYFPPSYGRLPKGKQNLQKTIAEIRTFGDNQAARLKQWIANRLNIATFQSDLKATIGAPEEHDKVLDRAHHPGDIFETKNTRLLNTITAVCQRQGIVHYRAAFDPKNITEESQLTFSRIV